MSKIGHTNHQDLLKWFQEFIPSTRRLEAVELAPTETVYSFPSSSDIVQPMIQLSLFTSSEFCKFIDGKPRSLAGKNFQQHNVSDGNRALVTPAASSSSSSRPSQISSYPVAAVVTASSSSSLLAPSGSLRHQDPKSIGGNHSGSFLNSVPDQQIDIPDSILEEMDLDKIMEEAEATMANSVGVSTAAKVTKSMSEMLAVQNITHNSYSLSTPSSSMPIGNITNSHSKNQSSSFPQIMPPPTHNNPVTSSKIVKYCHCKIECETVNITTSITTKRCFICRQLVCSFLEWVESNSSSGYISSNSFVTPHHSLSHQNYNMPTPNTVPLSTNYNAANDNPSYHGSYQSNTVDRLQYGGVNENVSTATTRNGNFSSSSYDNGGGYDSYPSEPHQINYDYQNTYTATSNPTTLNNTYNSSYTNSNTRISSSMTTPKPIRNPRIEVQKRFGHREFRPGQWDCIEAALQGRDVFCLMPTGGGKSMVYQLPSWCCAGVTVVFSPLISLIQDQVDALNAMGIRAVCLSQSATGQDYESSEGRMLLQELRSYHNYSSTSIENLPPAEQQRIQKEDEQRIKMLYITPEKFSRSQAVRSLLQQLMHQQLLSRFVLDEAHCLSQWGHDFRPDYLRLAEIRTLCPSVPIMALTATANQSVVQDIIKSLQMQQPFVHTQSFNRPNLQYKVLQKKGEKVTIEEIANYIVAHMQWTGIIYCLSRKDCETLVEDLIAQKPQLRGKVSFYHADLAVQEKEYRQRQWFKGDIRVLCATIAFGMGINKPDVRYVIHLHMPKSLTNYYQESGRAGRDGLNAECILYYSYKDKSRVLSMLDKSQASYDGQQRQLASLLKCLEFCLDEVTCRRQLILSYFGETFDANLCKNTCDTCQAMAILRQNFTINGISLSRLVETHDITHIAMLALHLIMATTPDNGNNNGGRSGGRNNGRYNNNSFNKLPKLTASKLAKLLSGSKGKDVNQYLSSLTGLKENLQPLFREQDIYNIHTQYSKESLEIICHRIIIDGFIREEHVVTNMQGNYGADYLVLGARARELLDGKQRVYIKFRGSLPNNGYGPNTGITNSVAAKSNKKNSSKSSHSNIVQANGQLGAGFAQNYDVEDLLSSGEHEEIDEDVDDAFRKPSRHQPPSESIAAHRHNNRANTAKSAQGVPKGSVHNASDWDENSFDGIPAAAVVESRKRKASAASERVPKNYEKVQRDPYAYLDESDVEEDVVQQQKVHNQAPVIEEDDWGDSDDSAQDPNRRAVLPQKKLRANDATDSVQVHGKLSIAKPVSVKKTKLHAKNEDGIVDLLEDSDAEEVALDPIEVAQRISRRRAAQLEKIEQMKQEQRQKRRLQKEAQAVSAAVAAAPLQHKSSEKPSQVSTGMSGTVMKSSAEHSMVYDYGDDNDDNFYYGEDNVGQMNNSSALDVSFTHSSLPSSGGQGGPNMSTLSLPGHSTKRTLDFDRVVHEEDDESASGVEGNLGDDDEDEVEFNGRKGRGSAVKLRNSSPKKSLKKRDSAGSSVKAAKSKQKFRTFLDDDDEEDFNEETDDIVDAASDLGDDDDDNDEDSEIANIAMHAFPRRQQTVGSRKNAALAPLFTQSAFAGKKGFKSPYLSQFAKRDQEADSLLEAKRLDAIGENGLSGRQQDALRLWLQAYRRRWANYWHHLSDASLEYIVTQSLPQTMAEVSDVPGIGESRAMRDGPELLATLGAFVMAQSPASEMQRLCALFPILTQQLPPEGVLEDVIWRDPQSEAAQLKMSNASSNAIAGVPGANRLSFPSTKPSVALPLPPMQSSIVSLPPQQDIDPFLAGAVVAEEELMMVDDDFNM